MGSGRRCALDDTAVFVEMYIDRKVFDVFLPLLASPPPPFL